MSKVKYFKNLITGKAYENAKDFLNYDKVKRNYSYGRINHDSNFMDLRVEAERIRDLSKKGIKVNKGDSSYLNELSGLKRSMPNFIKKQKDLDTVNSALKQIKKKQNIARGSLGALALAGVYGANKLIKKEKEKNASSIVDEAVEKLASPKSAIKKFNNIINGKETKRLTEAINDNTFYKYKMDSTQEVASDYFSRINSNLRNAINSKDFASKNLLKKERDMEYVNLLANARVNNEQINATKRLNNQLLKTNLIRAGATTGALALAGAGAYGLKKMYDRKKDKGVDKMNKQAFNIVNETFEKIAKEKNENDTRFWGDRVVPNLGRGIAGMAAVIPGAAAGYALTKNPLQAARIGSATGMGTMAVLSDKALRSKSQELLGRDATKKERIYNGITKPALGALATRGQGGIGALALNMSTPESQVKRRVRAKEEGLGDEGVYFWNNNSKRKKANKEKSASQVHYELEIEKKAEIYFKQGPNKENTLYYDADDSDIEGLDYETENKLHEDANNYINNHPNKLKAFEDMEFNRQKLNTRHKHSGKVRAAATVLGTAAPTLIGAGIGAATGAINPKHFQQGPVGKFVFEPIKRGQAVKKGLTNGAKSSLAFGAAPHLIGSVAGSAIGELIGNKMDMKAKKKMGPNRFDNIDTIESDLDSYIENYKENLNKQHQE